MDYEFVNNVVGVDYFLLYAIQTILAKRIKLKIKG